MNFLLLATAMLSYAEAPTVRADDSKLSLSIMNIRPESEINPATIRMLSELLATETAKYDEYQVLGEADLKALMEVERQNQLLGCDHEHCVVEVAQALGADQIIFSSVGMVGGFFLFNTKLYDGISGKILRRWAKQIPNDENELVKAMRLAADALLGKSGAVSRSELLNTAAPRTGRPKVAPWITGTVAVVSAAAGAWLGHLAQQDLSIAPSNPSYPDKLDGAEKKVLGANLSYGLAGAAGLLTGLLIVF